MGDLRWPKEQCLSERLLTDWLNLSGLLRCEMSRIWVPAGTALGGRRQARLSDGGLSSRLGFKWSGALNACGETSDLSRRT